MKVSERESCPRVTVVIPAYNSASFIGRAIRSALEQDYPAKEIIVVDDGSTDNTGEVVTSFGDKVRYLLQKKSGPAVARNRAIRHSKAEFIAFLDSDDQWLPGRLTKCLQPMIEDHSVGLTYCHSIARLPDGREIPYGGFTQVRNLFPRYPFPSPTHSTPATTCRRDLLLKVGGFDRPLLAYEDHDLWMRVGEQARIACIEEPLVIIHIRPDSLSASNSKNRGEVIRTYFQIVDDAFARRPDLYGPRRRFILADAHYFWAVRHYARKEYSLARRGFFQSFRHMPTFRTSFCMIKTLVPPPLLDLARNGSRWMARRTGNRQWVS